MSGIGKSLEAAVRKIRPYLSAKHRLAYASLVSRGMSERRPGEKIVCCDFSSQSIDAVGGRYYFSLVRDIIDAGFFPVFTARRQTLSTFGTSAMKSLLLGERMGVVASLDALQEPYFLITDDPSASPPHAERVITVDYERRVSRSVDEIAFPVFVHPRLAMQGGLPVRQDLSASRPARLFFGGNTEQGKYDKPVLRDTYGMLTRREMLDIVAREAPAIHCPVDAASWFSSQEFHPYVLCETQRCKIPQNRWLEALARADFFLACPGVGMPLCHNLIESLAAGAIPILQYADYLTPRLIDGKTCLAFSDAAGLTAAVKRALAMSPEEIQTLRAGVRGHYEEHLAPGRFVTTMFSGPARRTLLLNDYRVPRR